jgi:MFS family permease
MQTQGMDAFSAGLVASLLPAGFLVSAIVVGAFSDYLGVRKPFVLVMGAASGPAVFLTGIATGIPLWVTVFLSGLFTVGVLTIVLAIPVETAALSRSLSSAFGVVASLGNLGSFVLPAVVGQLRDISGTFLFSLLLLAVVGEGMLAVGFLLPETGRKAKTLAPQD